MLLSEGVGMSGALPIQSQCPELNRGKGGEGEGVCVCSVERSGRGHRTTCVTSS